MAAKSRSPFSSHSEIVNPVNMRVDGSIPSWVNGKLVRIGPGMFEFGKYEAVLPMDGMGLLHAFNIQDGEVTFQSRYIASDILKKNIEAERYVCAEFGTPASPDPKKSKFGKLKDMVTGSAELSDNSNHNVCYWKENNVLLVIGLPMFAVDPKTLEHRTKVTLPEKLGIDVISEHVHIEKDGTLYLLGSHVRGRPTYNVVKVPPKGDVIASFAAAEVVFTIPGQFKVTPTSHHNFFMTDNFFVIIENPLEVNVMKILTKSTIREALNWDPSVSSKFHVFNRQTGKAIKQKMESDSFIFLHSPNAYEDNKHLVLDMFTLNKFTIQDLFVPRKVLASPDYFTTKSWTTMEINQPVRYVIPSSPEDIERGKPGENLVKLSGEEAEVTVRDKSKLLLKSRPLTNKGEDNLQYPCINAALTGKPYTYFYAGGYGESKFLQFGMGKFNIQTKEVKTWEATTNQFLSEPVFIANPEGTAEDDGVLLFSMQDYAEGEDRLVVVDAKSMSTLAQVYFDKDSSYNFTLPEAAHAVFIPA